MATCKSCNKQVSMWEIRQGGVCNDCHYGKSPEDKAREQKIDAKIDAIMLTTETAPNLKIMKRIEIVTAECAFGMNAFRDLFAGVRNIVGGRSEAVQQTMRDSRRVALYELKKEAYEVGANAVVGVDLDYVELSSSGSMVMLVASGTAVIVEDL